MTEGAPLLGHRAGAQRGGLHRRLPGDWHKLTLVKDAADLRASMRGVDTTFADRYFFDFNS